MIPRVLQNRGQVLENVVFVELLRRGLEVFHYRSATGTETDFVTVDNRGGNARYFRCATASLTLKRNVVSYEALTMRCVSWVLTGQF